MEGGWRQLSGMTHRKPSVDSEETHGAWTTQGREALQARKDGEILFAFYFGGDGDTGSAQELLALWWHLGDHVVLGSCMQGKCLTVSFVALSPALE